MEVNQGEKIKLGPQDSALVFRATPNGHSVEMLIPSQSDDEVVPDSTVLMAAIACLLTHDEEWVSETLERWDKKTKELEAREDALREITKIAEENGLYD